LRPDNLVWSDVVGNVQRRWLEDDGRVTDFRNPSNNANGSTFDFDGRLVTTEDFYRRVVRFEHDGSVTVLADNYQRKPLNSPNDLAPHPDGASGSPTHRTVTRSTKARLIRRVVLLTVG
jgi:gluconolactonase